MPKTIIVPLYSQLPRDIDRKFRKFNDNTSLAQILYGNQVHTNINCKSAYWLYISYISTQISIKSDKNFLFINSPVSIKLRLHSRKFLPKRQFLYRLLVIFFVSKYSEHFQLFEFFMIEKPHITNQIALKTLIHDIWWWVEWTKKFSHK